MRESTAARMGLTVAAILLTAALAAGAYALAAAGPASAWSSPAAEQARDPAEIQVAELRILKASRIIGLSVRNREGEALGRIEELVIDNRTGEVAYAVLSHGGNILGFDSKYIAVPWEGLKLQATDRTLVLDASEQQLGAAEGLDWQGDWPLEPDPVFRGEYAAPEQPASIIVPVATEIPVELDQRLSSDTTEAGQEFTMTVSEPVRVSGRVAIPQGTIVAGSVAAVQAAERPNKRGVLEIEAHSVEMRDQRIDLRARVTADGEEIEGRDSVEEDLEEIGVGAAVGAVLGGLIKGGKGALAGLIIGGAGTFLATKGEQVELPAGTPLLVELRSPLEVPTETP